MNYVHLNDEFSVSDQLVTDDIALAHAMGFKSIICNRPDGEEMDQPLFEAVAAVAANSDIETAYVPVKAAQPAQDDFARMAEVLGRLPTPVLAYCRTGGRSRALLERLLPDIAPADDS